MKELPKLDQLTRVHIVGICGTLMGAFARFLKNRGVAVQGSDANVYPPMSDVLKEAGIPVFEGFKAENIKEADLIVIGNVVRKDNPEAVAALAGDASYCSLPEFMEQLLLAETQNLVVAGTHGKTTTSSMLAHVLRSCGADPSYFVGGVGIDFPDSFYVSSLASDRFFVLEGDEYDTAFWDKVPKFFHYRPSHAILTSVEFDHADIYADMDHVRTAFLGLVERLSPKGSLVCFGDSEEVQKISSKYKGSILTYGLSDKAQYQVKNLQVGEETTRFEISDGARIIETIEISKPGEFNALNATAVWLLCKKLELPGEQIKEGLRSFRGMKRRQEVRGEFAGVTVIDDFAHHPTAVGQTVRALKLKYGDRRLVVAFEPRSAASRRRVFQKQYAESFEGADLVFIAPAFDQSRIDEADRFSSDELVADLKSKGLKAELLSGPAQVVKALKPRDVLAVCSNGGFGGLIEKVRQQLCSE